MTRAWTLKPGEGLTSLNLDTQPEVSLNSHQVRVAIKANSINARDLMIVMGHYPLPTTSPLIPLSDGAGVITEVGEAVSHLSVGDRVVIAFNPAHQDGDYHPDMEPSAHGALQHGLLSEQVSLHETAVIKLPDNISFEQAACLPCTGVTAWNALFGSGSLLPGQTVLATGTGNVSLVALALAKAAGARFGITSSDDKRLSQAMELGADFCVNYQNDNWEESVRESTGGRGADVILENAGPPSVASSIRATARGGRVVQIGWKGMEGPPLSVIDIALGGVSLIPIMVGSRVMLQQLVNAVSLNSINIPIDASFRFEEAADAFNRAASGNTFGKILITNSVGG